MKGFMLYAAARIEQKDREALFQYYMSDYQLAIYNAIAGYLGLERSQDRFYDRVKGNKPIEEQGRNGDDVLNGLIAEGAITIE